MFRSFIAVISGGFSWGALCLIVNQILYAVAPNSFNQEGITDSSTILFFLLVMSVIYSI
jgi:hypothetical protein